MATSVFTQPEATSKHPTTPPRALGLPELFGALDAMDVVESPGGGEIWHRNTGTPEPRRAKETLASLPWALSSEADFSEIYP